MQNSCPSCFFKETQWGLESGLQVPRTHQIGCIHNFDGFVIKMPTALIHQTGRPNSWRPIEQDSPCSSRPASGAPAGQEPVSAMLHRWMNLGLSKMDPVGLGNALFYQIPLALCNVNCNSEIVWKTRNLAGTHDSVTFISFSPVSVQTHDPVGDFQPARVKEDSARIVF